MKIKYSGPPFYHFKVGIITPGVQEIEDEWALKLLKAGIVENCIDEIVGAGSPRPGQGNPAPLSAVPAQAGTGEPEQGNPAPIKWVEGLAQPVAEEVLEEVGAVREPPTRAHRDAPLHSRAPEQKRRRYIDRGA